MPPRLPRATKSKAPPKLTGAKTRRTGPSAGGTANYNWDRFKLEPREILRMMSYFVSDSLAIAMTVLVLAHLYNVPGLKQIASVIVAMSHNATAHPTPEEGGGWADYVAGPYDVTFTLFMVVVSLILHDLLREAYTDSAAKKSLGGNLVVMGAFQLDITDFTVALFAVPSAFSIVRDTGLLSDVSLVWEEYPHPAVNPFTKFFFLFNAGYFAWRILHERFVMEQSQRLPRDMLGLTWTVLVWSCGLSRFGSIIFFLHHLAAGARRLHAVLVGTRGNRGVRKDEKSKKWFSGGDKKGVLGQAIDACSSLVRPLGIFVVVACIALAARAIMFGGLKNVTSAEESVPLSPPAPAPALDSPGHGDNSSNNNTNNNSSAPPPPPLIGGDYNSPALRGAVFALTAAWQIAAFLRPAPEDKYKLKTA